MNPLPSAKHRLLFSTVTLGLIASILAAVGDGLELPLTKLFVTDAGVFISVAFLFFGGAAGMLVTLLFGRKSKAVFDPKRHLQKKDTWKLLSTVGFTIFANILILLGLQQESAGAASILQNVMTVAIVVFAFLFLKEKISKQFGIGVALIVLGSIALSITNVQSFSISAGSLYLIAGYIAMGGFYTVMKLLSDRNPVECNLIRCFLVGTIALIIAFCLGERLPSLSDTLGLMTVGFIVNGLANMLLMYGQRHLGAARVGAIDGLAPLLGVIFAIPILGEAPTPTLLAALILFTPGMYFVIMEQRRKKAAAAADGTGTKSKREDAIYLQSISEEKKSGMRNQLTSFGFLLIAMFFVMMVLGIFESGAGASDVVSSGFFIPGIVLGIFLLLIGIILLVLGKRVLTAVTFILMVPQIFAFVLLGNIPMLTAVAGIFSIIFALILLTSKDPQKYAFAAVNALLGVAFISNLFNSTVCCIIVSAASVFLIWLSLVCGTGKLQYSIAKHLTEDGDMTFSRCGAVIGFLLIAKSATTGLIYDYLLDSSFYTLDSVLTLGVINACLTAFVGAMLLFIGKRQMTAVFFFGSAVFMLLELFCNGAFLYLSVIFGLVFGILVILRGDSLILPTVLLFGSAFTMLLYIQIEAIPEVQTAMLLITLACAAVSLYLAFAVFSEKPKLPVF